MVTNTNEELQIKEFLREVKIRTMKKDLARLRENDSLQERKKIGEMKVNSDNNISGSQYDYMAEATEEVRKSGIAEEKFPPVPPPPPPVQPPLEPPVQLPVQSIEVNAAEELPPLPKEIPAEPAKPEENQLPPTKKPIAQEPKPTPPTDANQVQGQAMPEVKENPPRKNWEEIQEKESAKEVLPATPPPVTEKPAKLTGTENNQRETFRREIEAWVRAQNNKKEDI